jgi:hypothetical protein
MAYMIVKQDSQTHAKVVKLRVHKPGVAATDAFDEARLMSEILWIGWAARSSEPSGQWAIQLHPRRCSVGENLVASDTRPMADMANKV